MFKPHYNSLAATTGKLAGEYVRARQEMAITLRKIFGDMVHDGSPLPIENLADPRNSGEINDLPTNKKMPSPGVKEKPVIDVSEFRNNDRYTVFVLGAGTSKGVGFPICSDFFSQEYLGSIGIELGLPEDERSVNIKGIEELLMEAYASDRAKFDRLTNFYERVFFKADSRFKNVTGEVPTRRWVDETLQYFFLVAYFLEASASDKKVVVVSFNHDLCVEELVLNQGFNYGTLTNRMYSVGNYPGLPNFGSDFVLLKMHGSFNFAHCTSCNAIWCERDWVWDKGNDWPCGACGNTGKNFYVPPSVIKDVSKLKESWDDAKYFLERAEEVFVIGYSLPSYDSHAVELFKNTNPTADLAIVDPFASNILERYANTVPAKNRYYVESTWEEFTQDLMFEYWPFVKF
jgi:NAD-dependent SIR2 family protein deacetylase